MTPNDVFCGEVVDNRKKSRLILLANDIPGLRVCEYLVGRGDRIERLYLHEPREQKHGEEIAAAARLPKSEIFHSADLKNPDHVAGLKALAADFIIVVYWAHLISPEVIGAARMGSVNLHPALLPINRGWYSHVHSILDGTPTGVTLHAIDATVDTGPIWAQKPVPLTPYDTAFTIFNRLQDEIVKLFIETWPKIASGEIKPQPQKAAGAVYHKKSEIEQLDKINLDAVMKVSDVINLLRARSFGERGFAYYEKDGKKVYVNLRLSETGNFE